MPKKILSIATTSAFRGVGLTPLPAFPRGPEDLGAYLLAINPAIEVGLVTKSGQEEAKINKLRLIIAFLSLHRLVEKFSVEDMEPVVQTLSGSVQTGEKLLHALEFCTIAKDRHDSEEDPGKRYYLADAIFDSTSSEEADCISIFLSHYPPNGDSTDKPRIEKRRGWSDSDEGEGKGAFLGINSAEDFSDAKGVSGLQLQDIEAEYGAASASPRKLSGGGSDHSKESDPSSQGREDFVSLTSTTLRRTLKNYWRAKEAGVVVQDEILCSLWDKSIVGKRHSIEAIEQAISFFPLELAFLWDRDTQVVTAFDIGKSHAIEIRDLTESERARYTVIVHNHPHGDTFSLEDLVLCSNKGAKEVRAVTISCESPETMSFKSYRCEILDIPGFDADCRMHLLNAVHLYFANGREIENALEPYEIDRSMLTFRENEFSVHHFKHKHH